MLNSLYFPWEVEAYFLRLDSRFKDKVMRFIEAVMQIMHYNEFFDLFRRSTYYRNKIASNRAVVII